MKPYCLVILIGLISSSPTFSQTVPYKENNAYSFTVNVGASTFASALSWSHYHGIGKNKRFKIGYGLRFTSFFGSDVDYITAPAKYTSGKSGFGALFSEDIVENLDTVSFSKAQMNFLNAGIYLAYVLPFWKNRLEIGVNIDALGFTFGGRKDGLYKNSVVSAKPTTFNVLLISDSDIGSLNSEWYLSYAASKRIAVKIGYEFLFTEYTTDDKIQQIPNSNDFNDRFRLKSSMLMLGIIFTPHKK